MYHAYQRQRVISSSEFFDERWYLRHYSIPKSSNPVKHYLTEGWKKGYDPSPFFCTNQYLWSYPDVKRAGLNPLLHYELDGRKEGRLVLDKKSDHYLISHSKYFDAAWYKNKYNLTDADDPVVHYLENGESTQVFPSKMFSGVAYYHKYPDVREEGYNPLLHYERFGRKEGRTIFQSSYMCPVDAPKKLPHFAYKSLAHRGKVISKKARVIQNKRIQDCCSQKEKKLIVFIVPPVDYVGGGVMSICSIAKVTKSLEINKDTAVIIATSPSKQTFDSFTQFETDFDVYRFSQLPGYFKNIDSILVHIPEVYVPQFLSKASPSELMWLYDIPDCRANILNQNNELMPGADTVADLKEVFPLITITLAHKRYCYPQMRTSYDASIHFMSTSNFAKYEYKSYANKENLLVYSSDENVHKELIVAAIEDSFPEMEVVEIKGMKYAEYLDIISRAKWMITFGEGLDGYFVESLRSGAVPFAVNNNVFFDERYESLPNLFNSYSDMHNSIAETIQHFDNQEAYSELSSRLIEIDKVIYDDDEYVQNIKDYYEGNYTYPIEKSLAIRSKVLESKPLISVVMATYNGETYLRQQLQSINCQTYTNMEIIISDDGSTDDTLEIIRNHHFIHPMKLVQNTGPHGPAHNFGNGIKYARGEYVALSDQDDIWIEDKLETLLEYIEDYDVVHGKCLVVDERGKPHSEGIMHAVYEIDKSKLIHFTDFIAINPLLGCTSLIRKDFLDTVLPFPEDVLFHDGWIALSATKSEKGLVYVHKPVVHYRQHQSNTAKEFYSEISWLNKQYRYNKAIERHYKHSLSRQEITYLETNRNWCMVYKVFAASMPRFSYEYFHSNLYSLTNETIEYLVHTLKEHMELEDN